jgi:lipopolysaccharide transport system ATP-binding protein
LSDIAIKVENLSKQYRLGTVGTGTISHDLNRWWASIRGKDDPFLKVGETNDRASKGDSDYVWSLKDINFKVKQGEVLGIIGKNGAGKSTLLKILSKVTGPTTGRISAKGRIGALLEVGTGFHPELTGRENIFLNGAILGMTKPEIRSKLDEIIDFSGCARYVDTPVKRYSSGMKVRLAFAVAAFLEPEILIVDEVLAVGDAEFQKKAVGKMQDVSKGEGRTVLFVSHNMAAVQNLCSKALILNHGQVFYEGKTDLAILKYLETNVEKQNNQQVRDMQLWDGHFFRLIQAKISKSLEEDDSQLITGGMAYFSLKFESSIPNLKLEVAIHLYSQDGTLLTSFSPSFIGLSLVTQSDSGRIICKINKMPLMKGNYTFGLFLRVNDTIESNFGPIGEFFIEKGDFYGSGFLPKDRRKSIFCVEHNWFLEN